MHLEPLHIISTCLLLSHHSFYEWHENDVQGLGKQNVGLEQACIDNEDKEKESWQKLFDSIVSSFTRPRTLPINFLLALPKSSSLAADVL